MSIGTQKTMLKEYAKRTSRKIKSALRTRKMQGKYMAVTAPFGYKKDDDHSHLVIDEVTAPVVELEIAERLNVQLSADKEQQKKELRQYKQRVSEIENLYAKLYEDMTRELITVKRFRMRPEM